MGVKLWQSHAKLVIIKKSANGRPIRLQINAQIGRPSDTPENGSRSRTASGVLSVAKKQQRSSPIVRTAAQV